MKKWICIIMVITLALGITGCTAKVSGKPPENNKAEVNLPETLELSFKPLELTQLKEEKPKENWKLIKSFPFGTIENEQVTLHLYKEEGNDNFLKAQLNYKGYRYTLDGEVSSSIFQNGLDEMRHGMITKTSYLLQHQYGDNDDRFFLLGGIELYANGPGLVGYLIYDIRKNTWLQFDEWGIPYLADLDSDNSKELTIQFPGLHMQTPNVYVIRWHNGKLEKSEDFKTALGIDSYQPSIVNVVPEDNMHFAVEVNMSGQTDVTNLDNAFYKYEKGKLIKTE